MELILFLTDERTDGGGGLLVPADGALMQNCALKYHFNPPEGAIIPYGKGIDTFYLIYTSFIWNLKVMRYKMFSQFKSQETL